MGGERERESRERTKQTNRELSGEEFREKCEKKKSFFLVFLVSFFVFPFAVF